MQIALTACELWGSGRGRFSRLNSRGIRRGYGTESILRQETMQHKIYTRSNSNWYEFALNWHIRDHENPPETACLVTRVGDL